MPHDVVSALHCSGPLPVARGITVLLSLGKHQNRETARLAGSHGKDRKREKNSSETTKE